MKTQVLITSLLLLICTAIFAVGDTSTANEQWRKTQELNQLAERFKEETGFRGEVMHSTTTMRLHVYRGNFPGVTFTADGDTIAFRQACEGIISKVLPNSQANSNQLSMSRISKSGRGYTTDYYQQVGGYRVEGAGYIMITFEDGRGYFSISDNTVELPEGDVSAMISKAAAEQIALSDMNDAKYQSSRTVSIYYTNRGSETYYLAFLVCVGSDSNPIFGDYFYLIDSISGKIAHKRRANFIHSDGFLNKSNYTSDRK